MSRQRSYQTEAIIIKKTKLGEADRILTLYTPALGKIQGVARGIRRPRARLAGHLELLTHSQVSLARGRNIDTIIGAQTINSFLPLKTDLWLSACALYVTELVNQFTADHIENRLLFDLLLETLHLLRQTGGNELVLHYFEMHLLGAVGYRPELRQCVSCREPLQPTTNLFSPSAGGMLCPDCQTQQSLAYPTSVNAIKVLRLAQDEDCGTLIRLRMDRSLASEVLGLTRRYLRHLLERELKSAAWLDNLRAQMASDRATLL